MNRKTRKAKSGVRGAMQNSENVSASAPTSCLTSADQSMLSAAASPVRTSATPENGQASTESEAACGQSTSESFASYDPATSSWKTSQRCLEGGWVEFSGTWPRAGTMQNGIACRRRPLVPRISATVCSYSPSGEYVAPDAAKGVLWPAPDAGGSSTRTNSHSKDRIRPVLGAAVRMWPTPRARDGKGCGFRDSLPSQVFASLLPTPTGPRRSGLQSHGKNIVAGSLNPMWVEWLMGFPLNWSVLEE